MQTQIQVPNLKVQYGSERIAYKKFYDIPIDYANIRFVASKIARHFKLGSIYVDIAGYSISRAYRSRHRIRMSSHSLNFGVLCHELNHFLCWKDEVIKGTVPIRHGTKKWNRDLQRIFRYAESKNFWQDEIAKRTLVHDRQIEKLYHKPTKDELKAKKIARLENNLKRYRTKLKLYSNKLKRAERHLKRLQ